MTASPTYRQTTCRDCGLLGQEDVHGDLMPDTCPRCFERRIAAVFASTPPTLEGLIDALVGVGCRRDFLVPLLGDLCAAAAAAEDGTP